MLSRNLDKARKAYKENDVEMSKKAHQGDKLETEVALNENKALLEHSEKHKKGGEFLKSAVYGGLDGMITTYSVVMGAGGASLGVAVVLILGIANMIGDGLSMALGDYLSTKSEQEYQKSEKKRETWEVENNLEGEKQEMIEVYKGKGLSEEDAKSLTETIAKHKEAFVAIMMVEELGLIENDEHPGKGALVTFISFLFFGFIPLLPFVIAKISGLEDSLFIVSTVLTGFSLFSLGVLKTIFTMGKWYYQGLETLTVGAIAAGASFLIGWLMEPLTS